MPHQMPQIIGTWWARTFRHMAYFPEHCMMVSTFFFGGNSIGIWQSRCGFMLWWIDSVKIRATPLNGMSSRHDSIGCRSRELLKETLHQWQCHTHLLWLYAFICSMTWIERERDILINDKIDSEGGVLVNSPTLLGYPYKLVDQQLLVSQVRPEQSHLFLLEYESCLWFLTWLCQSHFWWR